MGNVETGSSLIVCADPAHCVTNPSGAGIEQAKDCGSSPRPTAGRSNALGRCVDQGSDGQRDPTEPYFHDLCYCRRRFFTISAGRTLQAVRAGSRLPGLPHQLQLEKSEGNGAVR